MTLKKELSNLRNKICTLANDAHQQGDILGAIDAYKFIYLEVAREIKIEITHKELNAISSGA